MHLTIYLFILILSCENEPVAQSTNQWNSTDKIMTLHDHPLEYAVLDTFSSLHITNDSLDITGKVFIVNTDQKGIYVKLRKGHYIHLSAGMYEVCTRNNGYVDIIEGKGRLETSKLRLDIDDASILRYLSGNYVITPYISESAIKWIPDSLAYK